MSRYAGIFTVIVLSFVISIFIGVDSPVYCEDGPTQDTADIGTQTKSAGQGANLYQDAGGSNLANDSTVQTIIREAPNYVIPIAGLGLIFGITRFQLSTYPGPISNILFGRSLWLNTVHFVGISTTLIYAQHYLNRLKQEVAPQRYGLPVLERPTPVRSVSMVEQEDIASKFLAAYEASKASNTGTDTDTAEGSIVPQYKALSVLEQGEGTNYLESILTFFADWLKANHSNVLPSDLHNNLLDYFSSSLSFTSINIIVIVMYTAGCYLLYLFPALLSLNYISPKFTSWTCVTNIEKIGKSVIQVSSSIIKLFIVILIFIILVCSAYLYFYCYISLDVSHYINDTMKLELNQSTDITIEHKFWGAPTALIQTLWELVLVLVLGIYRSMILIKPFVCDGNTKAKLLLCSGFFVKITTAFFIISVVKMPTEGSFNVVALVDVFAGYNKCYKLVFYSTITFIITNTIVYVINYYNKEKVIIENSLNNQEKEIAKSSNDYLFINFLKLFLKLSSYVAFFGMFQGILFLKGYSIPCMLDSYLNLY
jgi:hypothetical protein